MTSSPLLPATAEAAVAAPVKGGARGEAVGSQAVVAAGPGTEDAEATDDADDGSAEEVSSSSYSVPELPS